jgi:hypothetical protein
MLQLMGEEEEEEEDTDEGRGLGSGAVWFLPMSALQNHGRRWHAKK